MTLKAKYGAVVFNIHNPAKVNYFTLESSSNKSWFLGSTCLENNDNKHYNYGEVQECKSKDDFALLLMKRFSLYPSIWNKIQSSFWKLFNRKSNSQ